MNLKQILAEYDFKFCLLDLDYYSVKSEALKRAEGLGWEVVVVDFGDSSSLYRRKLEERFKSIKDYSEKLVLFFHDNLQYATLDSVLTARSHLEETVRRQPKTGGWNNKFIVTFDGLDEETRNRLENPLASSYFLSWKKERSSAKAERLEPLLGIVEAAAKYWASEKSYLRSTRSIGQAISLVGHSGSGKTTFLLALGSRLKAANLGAESYVDMEMYSGASAPATFADITKRNQGKFLLLDEAGLVTTPLDDLLREKYDVIIYASSGELPFFGLKKLDMPHETQRDGR